MNSGDKDSLFFKVDSEGDFYLQLFFLELRILLSLKYSFFKSFNSDNDYILFVGVKLAERF